MDLSEFLFDVKTKLESRGYVLDDETIKEAGLRLLHPVMRQQVESDELTVEGLVKEIEEGLRGRQERQQTAGAAGVVEGLPPGMGSRIAGEPNLALGASRISNLPADPRDQTLRNPILREPPTNRLEMT